MLIDLTGLPSEERRPLLPLATAWIAWYPFCGYCWETKEGMFPRVCPCCIFHCMVAAPFSSWGGEAAALSSYWGT